MSCRTLWASGRAWTFTTKGGGMGPDSGANRCPLALRGRQMGWGVAWQEMTPLVQVSNEGAGPGRGRRRGKK